jgi:alkylhydroperoxidase family enzyme
MIAGGPDGEGGWSWRHGVALRTSADSDGDVQRVLAKLEEKGLANIITRLMANSPTAFRPFVLMASALMGAGALPGPDREAVILDLASRAKLDYEWFEHVPVARREGFSDEQVRALEAGDPLSDEHHLFTASQLLGIRIARTLVDGQALPVEDWEAARSTWGLEGAFDLLLSVAWWGGYVPTVIRGLDLAPSQDSRSGF